MRPYSYNLLDIGIHENGRPRSFNHTKIKAVKEHDGHALLTIFGPLYDLKVLTDEPIGEVVQQISDAKKRLKEWS